jgi:hypothetical protein
MAEELTLEAWWARLKSRGHRTTESTRQTATGFTVWPDPGTVVTVAMEPDPTLYPQYRQRFFVLHPEPDPVFRVLGCPETHRRRWLELVAGQPPGYWQDFLAGPGSWLLCRLTRFRRVIAWSDGGLPWAGLDDPVHREWGMAVPSPAAPFFAPSDGPEAARPRLLPVQDSRFPDAVAACLLFASVGMRDWYLADEAAAEVYLAHHHEQVVASVPASTARDALLRELEEAGWLFRDVSGYESPMDEESEEDAGGGASEDP